MRLTAFDRFTATFAPRWTFERLRARAALDTMSRHYEAAQPGRRTSGWARSRGDANALLGVAVHELRMHARDLTRNNGWAKKARRVIANNTTGGWGLTPRPTGPQAQKALALWKEWADSTQCDADGATTFSGLQHLVMRTVATDGEVLLRKRPRRLIDGLAIPLQVEVLEADHLDTAKTGLMGQEGGPIILGVEHDAIGRRVAYWLFSEHPGSTTATGVSKRVPASEVQAVFYRDRPKQVRGVSWFGAGIVTLKELDEFEDAELMRQKIAACFAGFVTDIDGAGPPLGEEGSPEEGETELLEPGTVRYLRPGQSVEFASPPATTNDAFTVRALRKSAAALGVTYEDLTGDYSQVNFSSARMSRLSHWADIRDYQWNMLVPQVCQTVWGWAMEAARLAGSLPGEGDVGAEWTAPPMPMLEPDREGLAYSRLVRNGIMTHDDVVREQGNDPTTFWKAYAEGLERFDELGIVLDSDVRRVSQAGLTQERVGGKKGGEPESGSE